MGNVMVWNGKRKPPAGGAVGSSGIYRPSFAVGRSPSEIVRARMAELGIGTRLKSGKLALNKGKSKKNKAKSGRSAKACNLKGEKISAKEMQELLARPKTIDKKAAERMAKMLKGKSKGKGKASKAKAKKPAKAKPAAKPSKKGSKKPKAAKPAKKTKAVAKKPAKTGSKKSSSRKPAAKKRGKGGRKVGQLVLASTMTKARKELESKLTKQGAQLAALQKKLAANGKRGKRRKNTKANGSRKRSAAVAKRSGRRGSSSAKSATTTRSVSVAKKSKKAKGRKRTKAKSRRPASKKKKGARKSSRRSSKKPVAANRKHKGSKRKGGKRRNGRSMKMNNIWRALGITGSKGSEEALVAKLRAEFERRNRERMTAAQEARLSSQVRKALKKLASVAESEYEPSAKSGPGVDPRAVDAALKNLIGLGDAPKKKKPKRRAHKLTKREAQAAAAKAAKSGKAVKANKKRGKKRKASKAKRSNGKKKGSRKSALSKALAKAEKQLLAKISGLDLKIARKSKSKKRKSKSKSSKKSSSQAIAKKAAKSGKKGKAKAKKSNGKRRGKRRNSAWASGGVNVTDFARNGIREIVTDNFADPVRGVLVSVPGAVIGAAAAHMFPRLVASEFFARNALTRTLGAAIGGLLGVGVTSIVAGRLLGSEQGVIQGGAAALGASLRTVSQLVTSLTDPTSKLRMLVGTDATSLADAVNMSDMIPQGRRIVAPDGGVMIHDESQDALYEGAPVYGSGNYPDEMSDFAMPGGNDIVGDTSGEMADFAAPEMSDFAMPGGNDIVGDTSGEMADFAAPEMSDFAAPV